MSGLLPILPLFDQNQLLPPEAAYMARTDLTQTRMLGYTPFNLDAVTSLLLGMLGTRPTVRHRSGVTDEILDFLTAAGLVVEEDMRIYETGEEAGRHADQLIEQGYKLLWPYPLPEGRYPDSGQLVSPALWRQLNSKQNLGKLVEPAYLAPRRTMSVAELASEKVTTPVYLKSASGEATGWGYAIRHCPDQVSFDKALAWFGDEAGRDGVVVEAALPIVRCWCVAVAVGEDGARYVGAAEQLFSSPGQQSGNLIDPEHALPEAAVALAERIGDRAQSMGYRGLAGLDIGVTEDGRIYVFDPNFRINALTSQVLLHASAARRSGLNVSASFAARSPMELGALIARVTGPVEDGWFMPLRVIDAALLPAADGRSYVSGFVLGATREQAIARQTELAEWISGC